MYLILKNDFSNLLDHSVTQCILGTYTASIKNQSITDTTPHTNKMDAHKVWNKSIPETIFMLTTHIDARM
jgi:hypothetical protein